ncbi:hypothetical protein HPA18_02210 [Streptococcus suis]|nr:hypothetical protein [Streptococcus suis]
MKKIQKILASIITYYVLLLTLSCNTVFAEPTPLSLYEDNNIRFAPLATGAENPDNLYGIIGNRDRKYDDDVRAFLLKGVVGSNVKDLVIYLKPGESFTIDSPTIPGRTIDSVMHDSVRGNQFVTVDNKIPLPLTISYDDLVERGPFNNDEQIVSYQDRYILRGENDPRFEDPFIHLDGYYVLDYDGSKFNTYFALRVFDSFSWGYAGGAQSVPFKMYVLEGEVLPLPESLYGQTLTGIAFVRSEYAYAVTDVYTNNIVYSDIHNQYDDAILFMLYSEGSSNFDLSSNGQSWEALDFNKVPGVQEKLDEIEADKIASETEESISAEESEDTQYIDEEPTETKSNSVNGNAVAVGILITLSIIAFVVFYNKRNK